MSAPLLCPFCGQGSPLIQGGSTYRWLVTVCDRCEAQGPSIRKNNVGEGWSKEDEVEVLAEWNRRATTVRSAP